MRKAKIVCTIGPATSSTSMLEALVKAGMDVARLNFSHGSREEHGRVIEALREISSRLGQAVAILQDLEGPKIRLGKIKGGSARLEAGASFTLTCSPVEGDATRASTTYEALYREVERGSRILIDDGLIALEVERVEGRDVHCRVVDGGLIKDHKGINLPGVQVGAPSLGDKDVEDLKFGIKAGVDYVAVSFVRRADDVAAARELMRQEGADIPIIAKIEKPEAVDDLDRIIEVSDGVMVARGDLGVEVSPEKVPLLQKQIIAKANAGHVLVITATQMLESMTHSPRPTRAEASDVANAVFDGTDAVMLSGETAAGDYPIEAVSMMSRIVEEAEKAASLIGPRLESQAPGREFSFSETVADAAVVTARDVRARAIVAFTMSGFTARLVSKLRPEIPIIAFTPLEEVRRRLALYWGTQPLKMGLVRHTDEMIARVERELLDQGRASPGDVLVLIAGAPVAAHHETNMLQLVRVRDA